MLIIIRVTIVYSWSEIKIYLLTYLLNLILCLKRRAVSWRRFQVSKSPNDHQSCCPPIGDFWIFSRKTARRGAAGQWLYKFCTFYTTSKVVKLKRFYRVYTVFFFAKFSTLRPRNCKLFFLFSKMCSLLFVKLFIILDFRALKIFQKVIFGLQKLGFVNWRTFLNWVNFSWLNYWFCE